MSGRRMGRSGVAAGLALALAVAMPVEATGDKGAVTETVTVRNDLVLVLDTTQIGYGTLDPGATSAEVTLGATVSAPDGASWELTVSGTSFRSARHTMAGSVRTVKAGGADWTPLARPLVVARSTGGGGASVPMSWRVTIPADQAPGSYTGSLTFTVSAQ